jgi:hypothetical protein
MRIFCISLFVLIMGLSSPAYAMKSFLIKSTITSTGDTLCHYDNGTVLNIGVGMCPLSIG